MPDAPMPPGGAGPPTGGTVDRAMGGALSGGFAGGTEGDVLDEAQLDRWTENVQMGIYGGDTPDGQLSSYVESLLSASGEPAQVVGNAAADVANMTLRNAQQQQVELQPSTVVLGTVVVVDELAQVLEARGQDLPTDVLTSAAMIAVERLADLTGDSGLFDPQGALQFMEGIASDPGEFDKAIREGDPEGAQMMEAAGPEIEAMPMPPEQGGAPDGAPPGAPPAGGPPPAPPPGAVA